MSERTVRETLIKEVKVYGRLRVQIPTSMARDRGIKDGDTVQWVETGQGTYTLRAKPRYRSFVP